MSAIRAFVMLHVLVFGVASTAAIGWHVGQRIAAGVFGPILINNTIEYRDPRG